MYFWHIQNRPTSSSWDRYYAQSTMGSDQRNASITSGIAAALTIAIFFVVFLLTFCCRLITGHRRRQEGGQLANNHPPDADDFAAPPGYSLHDQQPHQNRMFVICGSNSPSSTAPPLPSYKDALNMFSVEKTAEQPSPPPFNAPFKLPQSNNKSEATDDSCQYRNNSSPPSPPSPFPHSMPAAESESGEMASNQSQITTEAFEENGTNLDDLNNKQSKK